MGRILRDIYRDNSLAPVLGFKGGTCAYFFYGLPRFSVDLDFDLLGQEPDIKKIFSDVKAILAEYGQLKDEHIKQNTILFHLSYGPGEHKVKIEISTRYSVMEASRSYSAQKYLGISMLAAKKAYLFAGKLLALGGRSELAMRDIYDAWFFAKNSWDIDYGVIQENTGQEARQYLGKCIARIEQVKENQILKGLGELVPEKDKSWLKNNLKQETMFLLENYQEVYR